MAIVSEFSVCALCEGNLDRPFFGLPDGASEMRLHLLPYFDSVVHFDCFANWKYRLEFSELCFRDVLTRFRQSDGYYGYLLCSTEDWAVICGPVGPYYSETTSDTFAEINHMLSGERADLFQPLYAEVVFREWVFTLRSNWFDWSIILQREHYAQKGLTEAMLDAIEPYLIAIRQQVPTSDVLEALLHSRMDEIAQRKRTQTW